MEDTTTFAPTVTSNLSLSLDEIIKQRRTEQQQKQSSSQKKARTPLKSKAKKEQDANKPTSSQKAVGSGKAKRDSKMAARRGLQNSTGTPSRAQLDKEIYRQQRTHNTTGNGGNTNTNTATRSNRNLRNKVYVGNLPWETTWQKLKDHIRDTLPSSSRDQVLRAEIMTQPHTQKSKGYGIVEFTSPKAAQEACRLLNDTEFEGRSIYVREDRIPIGIGIGADERDQRWDQDQHQHRDQSRNPSGNNNNNTNTNNSACSVYVGNLSYKTTWQDLKDHMRQAGNVDNANILSSPGPDGRSKGCGVVVFQHPKDAMRAIKTLQDSVLDGRELFIREDRESNSNHGQGPGDSRNNNNPPSLSVFVGNLSFDTKWQELKDHMRQAGNVDRVTILESPGPEGRSKGCGIVVYQHPKDVVRAIKTLQDSMVDGRKIFVREDREGGSSGGGHGHQHGGRGGHGGRGRGNGHQHGHGHGGNRGPR